MVNTSKPMSKRQSCIVEFIQRFYRENRYPPTIREIQDECKITSTSVVDYNLKALEERGLIRRNRKISRGIELLKPERSGLVEVPLRGRIAAGEPIPTVEGGFEEMIEIDGQLVTGRTDELFALRVKGHSMIDALIDDGDIVVLRHAETAEPGETVAVWLSDREETTLKRFYPEGNRVRLQPSNVTMAPIYVDAKQVRIQGKLVSVLRNVN